MYVGTDIIEIERIKEVLLRYPRFSTRILTQAEKEYCLGQKNTEQSVAGRFAAKEAVLKCLGTGLAAGISWHDIEIFVEDGGRPYVRCKASALAVMERLGIQRINVSISHSREYAVAVAVGEGEYRCEL